ncbi:hypothetical protein B7P43_G06686 [Cryptotermes secundus]|uniref:Uncharacterized protein n=1 Tax=Cryptotermes secundus TaxID=105785 RepID=A0A2J7Q3G0_9NEOP|nr:hypothetical protein B7P43_G06686 [Cryptotermes secundus]
MLKVSKVDKLKDKYVSKETKTTDRKKILRKEQRANENGKKMEENKWENKREKNRN